MKDQLALVKLHFSLNIAMIVQPVLTIFRSDTPMVFFLAKDLEGILRSLLSKFVKCSVHAKATTVASSLTSDMLLKRQ